jgi:uncharacterized protein
MATAIALRSIRGWRARFAGMHICLAVVALVAAVALALPAAAQTFPALSGRVVDAAGILDLATRASLAERLATLDAETTDQVVIATVPSLDGLTVETYANRLFRAWRLGRKDKNNGVLLLVAPGERKVRIEVGYGLEGTLTDAVAKLIIADAILPRFKAGDMPGGIVRGVDGLVAVLGGDAADWQRRAALREPQTSSHVHDLGTIDLPPVLGYLLLTVFLGVAALMIFFVCFLAVFLIVRFLLWIHVLPSKKERHGGWQWLAFFDDGTTGGRGPHSSGSSGYSGSSGSSDSFSGGGGDSGGGGASGSW